MKKLLLVKLFLVLGVIATIVSCSNDDDTYYYYPNDVAYGAIVNASPNSGNLYVYADDNQVNDNALTYTDARGYYTFYTGNRWFILKNQNGEVLDSLSANLAIGDAFTVFAAGMYDDVELVMYSDNVDYPNSHNVALRVINLTTDAPPVNIYVNGELFAEEVAFKESTGFINTGAGTYSVVFTNAATGEELFNTGDYNFYGGHAYTFYTKGYVTPPSGSNDTFATETITHF